MARAKKQKEEVTEQSIEEAMERAAQEEGREESDETAEDVQEAENTESAEEGGEDLIMTLDDVRLVEAMLFASSSSVSESQIAERFPADRVKLIPDILEHLREQYANRGVNLVQRDKRWALRTSTDLGDQLRLEKEQPKKFTRAAMETMAVVAYHQPVTRAEIENIRGVATSPGALDTLMEAGWIKPGKRREVPGRPVTWLSTQAFLDHFGLEKLGDLPGMEELKAAGLLDKRPAIEAMPTADLFGDDENKADGEDPQEVTDEDLIGDSGIEEEGEDTHSPETASGGDDDEDEDDEDFGDDDEDEDGDTDEEDSDDGDSDDEDDDEDYGEGDEDIEGDDEDADDGEGDEDIEDDEDDADEDGEDEDLPDDEDHN